MRICPNCRAEAPLVGDTCSSCNWEVEKIADLPLYLSSSDQSDRALIDYIESYKELSENDLAAQIVDNDYLSNQAKKALSYLNIDHKNILEVGVGQGILLSKLQQKYPSADLTAVDISIPFLRHVKERTNAECLIANAENLPFFKEFDLVVASDILEHVINPIDFLLSVNISLVSNGVFLLRVPYEDNMLQYSKLLGCQYKYAHLRNFSKRNLLLILRQAGFSIDNTFYDGYSYNRIRSCFGSGRLRERLIDDHLRKLYPSDSEISNIPNAIGRILMKPLEIVVLAKKTRTVTDMNFV